MLRTLCQQSKKKVQNWTESVLNLYVQSHDKAFEKPCHLQHVRKLPFPCIQG